MLSRDRKKVISIDLILANSDFLKRVLKRRREIRLLGIRTYLIAPEDLIILKLISFRKQDELDIENIIKSGETIDWKYLEEQIDMMKLNRDFIEDLKETLGEDKGKGRKQSLSYYNFDRQMRKLTCPENSLKKSAGKKGIDI